MYAYQQLCNALIIILSGAAIVSASDQPMIRLARHSKKIETSLPQHMLLVQGTANGQHIQFIVDTATVQSSIYRHAIPKSWHLDRHPATEAGKPIGFVDIVRGVNLSIDKFVGSSDLIVRDLPAIDVELPFQAIIGWSMLKNHILEMRWEDGVCAIRKELPAYARDWKAMPIVFYRGLPAITYSFQLDKSIDCHVVIDTGMIDGVYLGPQMYRYFVQRAPRPHYQSFSITAGRNIRRRGWIVNKITFGDMTFNSVRVWGEADDNEISRLLPDVIWGMDVLKQLPFVLDCRENRIYFKRQEQKTPAAKSGQVVTPSF